MLPTTLQRKRKKKGKIINKLSELLVLRKHEKGRSRERMFVPGSVFNSKQSAKGKKERNEPEFRRRRRRRLRRGTSTIHQRRIYEGSVHSPLKIYFQNTHSLNENCCLGFRGMWDSQPNILAEDSCRVF